MPIVNFTYDQKAIITCEAKCEVPQEIIDKGDVAVKKWLSESPDLWEEDGEISDTDYGETLGFDRYEILSKEDWLDLEVGQVVNWHDPDDGACSGPRRITFIDPHSDTVHGVDPNVLGSVTEMRRSEITLREAASKE